MNEATLVRWLWCVVLEPAARRDPQAPWRIAQARPGLWKVVAILAGVPVPDEETQRKVVVQVARLVTTERGRQPAECDDCRGSGARCERDPHSSDGCGPEYPCPTCSGGGTARCEHCGEAEATVAVPLGFYCAACARAVFAADPMEEAAPAPWKRQAREMAGTALLGGRQAGS